jgi:hypothetical protein
VWDLIKAKTLQNASLEGSEVAKAKAKEVVAAIDEKRALEEQKAQQEAAGVAVTTIKPVAGLSPAKALERNLELRKKFYEAGIAKAKLGNADGTPTEINTEHFREFEKSGYGNLYGAVADAQRLTAEAKGVPSGLLRFLKGKGETPQGFQDALATAIASGELTEQEKRIANAYSRMNNAFIYALSGKAITDNEYKRIVGGFGQGAGGSTKEVLEGLRSAGSYVQRIGNRMSTLSPAEWAIYKQAAERQESGDVGLGSIEQGTRPGTPRNN